MTFPGTHQRVQQPRGNTATNNTYVGADGQITVDSEMNELRLHDGVTAGGFRIPNLATILLETATPPEGTDVDAANGFDLVQRTWPATAFHAAIGTLTQDEIDPLGLIAGEQVFADLIMRMGLRADAVKPPGAYATDLDELFGLASGWYIVEETAASSPAVADSDALVFQLRTGADVADTGFQVWFGRYNFLSELQGSTRVFVRGWAPVEGSFGPWAEIGPSANNSSIAVGLIDDAAQAITNGIYGVKVDVPLTNFPVTTIVSDPALAGGGDPVTLQTAILNVQNFGNAKIQTLYIWRYSFQNPPVMQTFVRTAMQNPILIHPNPYIWSDWTGVAEATSPIGNTDLDHVSYLAVGRYALPIGVALTNAPYASHVGGTSYGFVDVFDVGRYTEGFTAPNLPAGQSVNPRFLQVVTWVGEPSAGLAPEIRRYVRTLKRVGAAWTRSAWGKMISDRVNADFMPLPNNVSANATADFPLGTTIIANKGAGTTGSRTGTSGAGPFLTTSGTISYTVDPAAGTVVLLGTWRNRGVDPANTFAVYQRTDYTAPF